MFSSPRLFRIIFAHRRIGSSWALVFAAAALTAFAATTPARADDCLGNSLEHVRPPGDAADPHLDVKSEAGAWFVRVRPVHRTDGPWHRVEGVPAHAHLMAVGPTPAGRFALLRAGGERDTRGRILLFDGQPRKDETTIKPRAVLDLDAMMTADELAALRPSVSHLQWLSGRAADAVRFDRLNGSMTLTLVSGRKVTLHFDARAPEGWRQWGPRTPR